MRELNNCINSIPCAEYYVKLQDNTFLAPIGINGGIGSILTDPIPTALRNLINGSQELNENATIVLNVSLMFSCAANIINANGMVDYYISTDYSDGNANHIYSNSIIPMGNATHYTSCTGIPVLISDIVHNANTLFKINIVNNMTSAQHGGNLVFVGANTFADVRYLAMGYMN